MSDVALYKNSRQQEFCNLLNKLEAIGMNQSDVAARLHKTRGAISQYVSGYANPSATVLELMRSIVEEVLGPPKEEEPNDYQLKEQIDDLKRFSPPDYEVIKTTINLLHKKLPAHLNSSTKDASKRMVGKAAAAVLKTGGNQSAK
ncbi:MAG TPA: helix-turn-helix transcriptional regulator [Verrucomicrobiae bacterium]